MTATYIQMIAALIFVILLIMGVGFLMRKKQGRSGLMSIISYYSMGPKRGVAALKIGKEVLILGVTPGDMRLLKTFKEDELDLTEVNAFRDKLDKFRRVG
jgi:flagellar biogenesis protein FliO